MLGLNWRLSQRVYTILLPTQRIARPKSMSKTQSSNSVPPTISVKDHSRNKVRVTIPSFEDHPVFTHVLSGYSKLPASMEVDYGLLRDTQFQMMGQPRNAQTLRYLLIFVRSQALRREIVSDDPTLEAIVIACVAFAEDKAEQDLYRGVYLNKWNHFVTSKLSNLDFSLLRVRYALLIKVVLLLVYMAIRVDYTISFGFVVLMSITKTIYFCCKYCEILALLLLMGGYGVKRFEINVPSCVAFIRRYMKYYFGQKSGVSPAPQPLDNGLGLQPVDVAVVGEEKPNPVVDELDVKHVGPKAAVVNVVSKMSVDSLGYMNDGDVKLPVHASIKCERRPTKFDQQMQTFIQTHVGTLDLLQTVSPTSAVAPDVLTRSKCVAFTKIPYSGPLQPVPLGCMVKSKNGSEPGPGIYYLVGPAYLGILPAVHLNSKANEYASLTSRHLKNNIGRECDSPAFQTKWEAAARLAYEAIEPHEFKKCSIDEWIAKQPPVKRKSLSNYKSRAINLDFLNDNDHDRSFFIKTELLVPTKEKPIKLKVPRGIQGLKKPEANLCLGPFMFEVADALKNPVEAPFKKVHLTSGSTPDQLGAWYHFMVENGYEIFEDDFSEYDSTQGYGAWFCENKLYARFQPGTKEKNALKRQQCTRGYGKYHMYKCPYTRKSGDQNTSLGNSFINASVHCYALNQLGCDDYYMLVLGDDNILAVRQPPNNFVYSMQEIVDSFGLKSKFVQSRLPSYCSANFMPVVRNGKATHLLVPNLFRYLSKCGWTCGTMGKNETPMSRMKGNLLSAPSTKLVPVLRVLYNYYTSSDVAATYDTRSEHSVHHGKFNIDEYSVDNRTLAWFSSAYNIKQAELEELESYLHWHLDCSEGLPSAWGHPIVSNAYQSQ